MLPETVSVRLPFEYLMFDIKQKKCILVKY
jgi:hypothetical protein